MKITNCNCGEKVDCGCDPYFQTYSNNTLSVLTVGNLVSDSCTFDEYVIDWYKDNIENGIEFTTGKGSHPDITYLHPLTGLASLPVEGGNWIPVIRFVVITGDTIYSTPRACQKWCDDLGGLPEITVLNNTCSNGGSYYNGLYSHKVEYSCTLNDVSDAARTVRFDLDSDGTVTDFAWWFWGYEIADRFTIIYCSADGTEVETLDDWIIGLDVLWNIGASPGQIRNSIMRKVVHLPAYTSGDYLKISVTPSVVAGNPLTNWLLYMKCFHSDFSCLPELTANMQTADEDTIAVTYNASACRTEVHFHTLATPPVFSNYSIFQYINAYNSYAGQTNDTIFTDGSVTFWLNDAYASASAYTAIGAGASIIQNGNVTIQKTGAVVTFTFENETDYLAWKTSWNNVINHAQWTNYSSDTENILHYKYMTVWYKEVVVSGTPGASCGDPGTTRYYYISYDSVVNAGTTFDDNNHIITLTLIEDVNGYTDVACSSVHETLDNLVSYANNFKNAANFTHITNCRYTNPFQFIYCAINNTAAQTSFIYSEGVYFYNYEYDGGPCAKFNQIHEADQSGVFTLYRFYTAGMYVTLSIEGGVPYYHAYSVIDANGQMITNPANFVLIKEGEVT